MGWSSSRRRFHSFVERLFAIRCPLVRIWAPETRQEHLLAVCGLDWFGCGSNCGCYRLRVMPMAATSNSRLLTDASASALMILASFLGMPYHRHLCWIHIPCESRRPNSALLTNVHTSPLRAQRVRRPGKQRQ
jgi:hypothetical protein